MGATLSISTLLFITALTLTLAQRKPLGCNRSGVMENGNPDCDLGVGERTVFDFLRNLFRSFAQPFIRRFGNNEDEF